MLYGNGVTVDLSDEEKNVSLSNMDSYSQTVFMMYMGALGSDSYELDVI